MNSCFQFMMIIVVGLLLSACQSDEEKPVILPVVQEKTATPPAVQEKRAVSVAPKLPEEPIEQLVSSKQNKVVEETVVQQDLKLKESPPNVDLNLSDGFLKKLDSDQNLASDPPEPLEEETTEQRKIKVSGGVLFDPENQDLVEKVDGGEVKISIPLN